ncbi:hypothetical protein NEMBOFW57_002024 [Staphylotrichum longicolle]|uniref:Uncharacterized protein n=1 Tax=Staphylotrichum longicolle TaxID=669026 RepID=A0AAD4HYC8_9PEZI|nr:hypothetical protein NEMBOFW57_002024 [Staphylotrichum longicolle]
MIYPFNYTLLRTQRSDVGVYTAIKKSQGVPSMTTPVLDSVLCRIFEEATALIEQKDGSEHGGNSVTFMRSLRARPGLRDLWKRRSVSMLTSIFLVLRCARLNWHQAPRPPYNVGEHCKTARAIDAFLAVDNLTWSDFAGLSWFVTDGLDLIKPPGKEEEEMENESQLERVEDEQGGDSDSDVTVGIFVKQTCPVPPEDVGETGTEHDNSGSNADTSKEKSPWRYQLSLEQIVEGMQRLNINVDETALTEAFTRLRIPDPLPPAPRKNGNPFLDDSD